jgi:tRNA threonylcarbamoyladenosine biosynthesis protein TsaB
MNTLAFDTCFGACSVAVTWSPPEVVSAAKAVHGAYRFERLERGHAERLLPMIGEAMGEAPFDFPQLARIVVTTGPGTFTGQRVGIAAARALSLATGAPVFSVTSLAVMAAGAAFELGGDLAGKVLAVAVDARRGEVYFQAFTGPDLEPLGTPALLTPEQVVRGLSSHEVIAVGSGAEALEMVAPQLGVSLTARLASLQPDVRLLRESAFASESGLPRPLYLRPPDAKPQDGAAFARVS